MTEEEEQELAKEIQECRKILEEINLEISYMNYIIS